MIEKTTCKYCGWEFPRGFQQLITENSDSVFCENCGTELMNENFVSETIKIEENSNKDLKVEKTNKKKAIFNHIYENIRNEKSPINRIIMDSDFPKVFKDNFKIVISRVIYSHIRAMELESAVDIKTVELTKEIIDKLYEEISPVLTKRIKREYLENLHKSSIRDFEKWIKILQTKLKLNKKYRRDFITYLRRLINEAYIIVSELWDLKNLPKFERIIRDDLKRFSNSTKEDVSSNSSEKSNIGIMQKIPNEKFTTRKFAGRDEYIIFLDVLRSEITKLVSTKELHRNRLANWRLAKYLNLPFGERKDGRKWDTISTISKGERHITMEDLEKSKICLLKYFGKKAEECINIINGFLSNNRLRRYSKQQWQDHNPNLNEAFFKGLMTDLYSEEFTIPSYWYGFMGSDGSLQYGFYQQSEDAVRDHKYRYQITIELSVKDKSLLVQFCENIGLDPIRIKERSREKWGKNYLHAYITFNCREMAEDLDKLGFVSSKEKLKEVPDYIKNAMNLAFESLNRKFTGPKHIASTPSGRIALTWLRGAYDGDGHSDRTELGSASRQFLESIRQVFKIRLPVRPHSSAPNFWILSLGARLYNAMTSVCKELGLGLKRKSYIFSENREALISLMETLEDLNIGKKKLQDLVFKSRLYELVKAFTTSKETLRKLLNEWNIILPSNGYWTSKKEDFLGERVK